MEIESAPSALETAVVVSLQPGDIVLFRTPDRLSKPQRDHIVQMLDEVFPAHESIVLEGGQDIAVMRPEPSFLRRLWMRLHRG